MLTEHILKSDRAISQEALKRRLRWSNGFSQRTHQNPKFWANGISGLEALRQEAFLTSA